MLELACCPPWYHTECIVKGKWKRRTSKLAGPLWMGNWFVVSFSQWSLRKCFHLAQIIVMIIEAQTLSHINSHMSVQVLLRNFSHNWLGARRCRFQSGERGTRSGGHWETDFRVPAVSSGFLTDKTDSWNKHVNLNLDISCHGNFLRLRNSSCVIQWLHYI